MKMPPTLMVGLLLLAGGLRPTQHLQGQAPTAFEGSRITHVGVIVRDPAKTGRIYSDVFGVPVQPPTEFKGKIDFPANFSGDRDAHPNYTFVTLPGIGIELLAPVGGASPWRDYLEKYGEGLHHICFAVRDIHAAIAQLQALGGKLEVGGSPGVTYAYVNFRDQLGFTIELSQLPAAAATPAAPSTGAAPAPFAQAATALLRERIGHVGVFVPDVEKTAALFGSILGKAAPAARAYPGIEFPKGFDGDSKAHPKIITFPMNAGVEFAEPQGGKSPWRDYVQKYGAAMHHLGIAAKVSIPETVGGLEKSGGRVLLSAPGGTTTFVELKPEPMALAIEVGSPPKN